MKSVLLHGVLALVGLLFAYQTWTRPPEEDAGQDVTGAIVMQCSAAGLQAIKMETPTHYIDVSPAQSKSATAAPAYWIVTRRKSTAEQKADDPTQKSATGAAGAPAPEPAATPTAAPKTVDPTVPVRYLANGTFKDYLKRLTPLLAARELGVLPKDKLADFGFDAVGTRLTLDCAGKSVTLEVGARTFGSGQRYLRDVKTKIAYLFDESFVADLQSAQFRFMQAEVHAFTLADVDEAVVSARGAHKRLVHRERKLEGRGTWVDAAEPTKRNELYGNWFSRLAKLRVREYLKDDAEPGADLGGANNAAAAGVTPVLNIEYAADGKPKGKLEIVRVDVGAVGHYYARTETTRTWVSLFDASAKDVESDVGMVVGLDEPAAARPAQSSDASSAPHSPH